MLLPQTWYIRYNSYVTAYEINIPARKFGPKSSRKCMAMVMEWRSYSYRHVPGESESCSPDVASLDPTGDCRPVSPLNKNFPATGLHHKYDTALVPGL